MIQPSVSPERVRVLSSQIRAALAHTVLPPPRPEQLVRMAREVFGTPETYNEQAIAEDLHAWVLSQEAQFGKGPDPDNTASWLYGALVVKPDSRSVVLR
jgi:hypothetical protein